MKRHEVCGVVILAPDSLELINVTCLSDARPHFMLAEKAPITLPETMVDKFIAETSAAIKVALQDPNSPLCRSFAFSPRRWGANVKLSSRFGGCCVADWHLRIARRCIGLRYCDVGFYLEEKWKRRLSTNFHH